MILNWKRSSISVDEATSILTEAYEMIDYVQKLLPNVDRPSYHWTAFMQSTLQQLTNLNFWLRQK